jgi:ABC transport system ATP-binding/permease protein
VLLLDEPTNDLDVETLAEVEDVLDGWAGTLVVVSHDRWFLERVCDDLYAVVDGTLRHLPGGVDEYLAIRRGAEGAPSAQPRARSAESRGAESRSAESRGAESRGAESRSAESRGAESRGADPRAARKELARIERRLSRIAAEEAALHESMAAVATEHEKVLALDTQLRAIADEKATLEEQWLLLADDAD